MVTLARKIRKIDWIPIYGLFTGKWCEVKLKKYKFLLMLWVIWVLYQTGITLLSLSLILSLIIGLL